MSCQLLLPAGASSNSLSWLLDIFMSPYFVLLLLIGAVFVSHLRGYRILVTQAFSDERHAGTQLQLISLKTRAKALAREKDRLKKQVVDLHDSAVDESLEELELQALGNSK
eukprot:1651074-Pleurochrysis_carterae.AAC.2